MRNDKFFDMKLREAGFNLKDEDECEFCNNLFDLVWKVIHGERLFRVRRQVECRDGCDRV